MGWLFGLFLTVTTAVPIAERQGLVDSAGYICKTEPSLVYTSSVNTLQLASFDCVTPPAATPTAVPPPPPVCTPADIVILLDRSGSMGVDQASGTDTTGTPVTKSRLSWAKEAVSRMVTTIGLSSSSIAQNMRVGVASYGESMSGMSPSTIDIPLNADMSVVSAGIEGAVPSLGGGSCIECGLRRASDHLLTDGDPAKTKIILLFSNGIADKSADGIEYDSAVDAQNAAEEARKGRESGIYYFVVSHNAGNQINETLLQHIASGVGRAYYQFEPLPDKWDDVFVEMLGSICPSVPPPPTRVPTYTPQPTPTGPTPTRRPTRTPSPTRVITPGGSTPTRYPTPSGPTPTRRPTSTPGPTSTPKPTQPPPPPTHTPTPTTGSGWTGYP